MFDDVITFLLAQERERDHFSQFITEGFISYCKRKRRDKVYEYKFFLLKVINSELA